MKFNLFKSTPNINLNPFSFYKNIFCVDHNVALQRIYIFSHQCIKSQKMEFDKWIKWDNILRHKYEKKIVVGVYLNSVKEIFGIHRYFYITSKKIYHDFKLIEYERIAFKMFIVV